MTYPNPGSAFPRIAFVHADDWVGLYRDGRLLWEGHSLRESLLLDLLGIPHKTVYAERQLYDLGSCPELLSDVEADP